MKKILSAVLAFVMVFCAVTASATSIGELKNQQQQLEQEAEKYQDIIDKKQEEIDEQEEYVNAVAEKVANLNDQISVSRSQIAEYDNSIAEKTEEVNALNAEAEANMETLRTRIRALYKAGDTSSIEIILGASDFSDFVDKIQLVESISDYDAKLIDDIESQLDDINAEMEQINADKQEQEKVQAGLEDKQSELNALLAEHEKELANLYDQKDEAEDLLHSAESAQSEVEQEIQDYYDSQNKPSSSGSSSSGSSGGSSGGSSVRPGTSGGYVWPVPGFYYLSSQYYEQRTGYYHGGIDIAGAGYMGTTVVAAASGTVIISNNSCRHNWGKNGSCGCGGGYGNWVWIDHGNGKATIYAHLTNSIVSVGQYVSAGQTIGYGGSTGSSTGPHLHFETRYYGSKYDPMSEY